jgi:hypothetical protein
LTLRYAPDVGLTASLRVSRTTEDENDDRRSGSRENSWPISGKVGSSALTFTASSSVR